MIQAILNFDAPALGGLAKRLGQNQALENEDERWKEGAMEKIRELAMRKPHFTSDDIRAVILGSGLLHPHAPAVWGSIIALARQRKWMTNSGRYVASMVIGNHARKIPVWMSLLKK